MTASKTEKNNESYLPTIFWIVIMGLFLTEMLFYTWCRVQCTKTGYAIARENEKNYDFLSLQKNLEIELTQLKSPNRVARIAKNQLGLDIPKPEQIRSLP